MENQRANRRPALVSDRPRFPAALDEFGKLPCQWQFTRLAIFRVLAAKRDDPDGAVNVAPGERFNFASSPSRCICEANGVTQAIVGQICGQRLEHRWVNESLALIVLR